MVYFVIKRAPYFEFRYLFIESNETITSDSSPLRIHILLNNLKRKWRIVFILNNIFIVYWPMNKGLLYFQSANEYHETHKIIGLKIGLRNSRNFVNFFPSTYEYTSHVGCYTIQNQRWRINKWHIGLFFTPSIEFWIVIHNSWIYVSILISRNMESSRPTCSIYFWSNVGYFKISMWLIVGVICTIIWLLHHYVYKIWKEWCVLS